MFLTTHGLRQSLHVSVACGGRGEKAASRTTWGGRGTGPREIGQKGRLKTEAPGVSGEIDLTPAGEIKPQIRIGMTM